MRKVNRREVVLLGVAAVGLLVSACVCSTTPTLSPRRLGQRRQDRAGHPSHRSRAARQPHTSAEAGGRNLFEFARAPVAEVAPEPPPIIVTPPPVAYTAPPGMTLSADGALDAEPAAAEREVHRLGRERHGVKVAVLVTDRREVLTGQAGQVVANRYRVARIGLESVDLEDVSTGQSKRVPLKGD